MSLQVDPGSTGHKAGDALARMPVHCRGCPGPDASSLQGTPWPRYQSIAGDALAQMPTLLLTVTRLPDCMSLDFGRNLKYLEETHMTQEEHANFMHTEPAQDSEPQLWKREATVLTAKPPQKYKQICAFTIFQCNNYTFNFSKHASTQSSSNHSSWSGSTGAYCWAQGQVTPWMGCQFNSGTHYRPLGAIQRHKSA